MKAIKVNKPYEVEIVEVETPKIENSTDVIIKVTAGGICGSDMGIWKGTNSLATYPRLIGHEFGGRVEQVGNDVKDIKVGDLVAVDPVRSCGHCYACRTGNHNVCEQVEVMGVHRDGGFSEYTIAPEKNIYKFNTNFDEKLVGLVEPFSIGSEVNNRANIQKGDKVLVLGAGTIGSTVLQIAKKRGAEVIISDLINERLERATDMGADLTVNSDIESLEEKISEFTNNEGIPVIVDTVCIPQTFKQSISLASPAGRIVCLTTGDTPTEINPALITKKGLSILGSRLNNYRFDEVIQGFEDGTLHPEKLLTDTFSYKDIDSALETLNNHPEKVLKVSINFDKQ